MPYRFGLSYIGQFCRPSPTNSHGLVFCSFFLKYCLFVVFFQIRVLTCNESFFSSYENIFLFQNKIMTKRIVYVLVCFPSFRLPSHPTSYFICIANTGGELYNLKNAKSQQKQLKWKKIRRISTRRIGQKRSRIGRIHHHHHHHHQSFSVHRWTLTFPKIPQTSLSWESQSQNLLYLSNSSRHYIFCRSLFRVRFLGIHAVSRDVQRLSTILATWPAHCHLSFLMVQPKVILCLISSSFEGFMEIRCPNIVVYLFQLLISTAIAVSLSTMFLLYMIFVTYWS